MVFHKLKQNDEAVFATNNYDEINFESQFWSCYIWSPIIEQYVAHDQIGTYVYSVIDQTWQFDPPRCTINNLPAYIEQIKQIPNKPTWEINLLPMQAAYLKQHPIADFQYEILPNPGYADYIYLASDLANYPGKKFQDKRNLVNQFNKLYRSEFREYQPSDLTIVKQFLTTWFNEKTVGVWNDNLPIVNALENYQAYGIKCFLLLVDQQIIGLTIFKQYPKYVDILFEKANAKYKGSYAILVQLTAKQFTAQTMINRESDLDIPGLRKSKRSYNPIRIIERFVLKPIN